MQMHTSKEALDMRPPAGSHNDLAGLSTSTDQAHFYSKLEGSQAVLAEPNIGVKVPVKTPAVHMQGGRQTDTTK